jgi:hypothetical protein
LIQRVNSCVRIGQATQVLDPPTTSNNAVES